MSDRKTDEVELNSIEENEVNSENLCADSLDESNSSCCFYKNELVIPGVHFLLSLLSKCVPMQTVEAVADGVSDMFADVMSDIECKVSKLKISEDEKVDLLSDFKKWKNPFEQVQNVPKLLTYLQKFNAFNVINEVKLGSHWERKKLRLGMWHQVEVTDNFNIQHKRSKVFL